MKTCKVCGKDISEKRGHSLTCSDACRKSAQRKKKAMEVELNRVLDYIKNQDDPETLEKIISTLAAKRDALPVTVQLPTMLETVNHLHCLAHKHVNKDALLRAIAVCNSSNQVGNAAQMHILIGLQRWLLLPPLGEDLFW